MVRRASLLAFAIATLTVAWSATGMAGITLNGITLNGVALHNGVSDAASTDEKLDGSALRATRITLPSGAQMTFR